MTIYKFVISSLFDEFTLNYLDRLNPMVPVSIATMPMKWWVSRGSFKNNAPAIILTTVERLLNKPTLPASKVARA